MRRSATTTTSIQASPTWCGDSRKTPRRDNFLSASFAMLPHDAGFERERLRFRASLEQMDHLSHVATAAPVKRASIARLRANAELGPPFRSETSLNEPDSDFAQSANRRWIADALAQAEQRPVTAHRIRGVFRDRTPGTAPCAAGVDPSRPTVTPVRGDLGISRAGRARPARRRRPTPANFSLTDPRQRALLLRRVAQALREARAELIALMLMDGGKRVAEADVRDLGSHRFCRVLPLEFPESPARGSGLCEPARRGGRDATLEFPTGHSRRRRAGCVDGRQPRDPQASTRNGPDRVQDGRAVSRCRCAQGCAAAGRCATTRSVAP